MDIGFDFVLLAVCEDHRSGLSGHLGSCKSGGRDSVCSGTAHAHWLLPGCGRYPAPDPRGTDWFGLECSESKCLIAPVYWTTPPVYWSKEK